MQWALSPRSAALRALFSCSCALHSHCLSTFPGTPRSIRAFSSGIISPSGQGKQARSASPLASRMPGLASTTVACASSSAGTVPQVGEIGVAEVQQLLSCDSNAAEDLQLIDVREEHEHQTASLPGFQLLPLSRFQEWGPQAAEVLDPRKETLVLCHHGVRSMRAALFLASQGFQDVKNISGGIDAYSRQVDSSVPLY